MKLQAQKPDAGAGSGATPITRRAAAKAGTRTRIVRVASRLMRRQGLGAASVPRVMNGAGLTIGGFYAHFRSKRAMDAEVLRDTLAAERSKWFRGLEAAPPVEWIFRAVRRYLAPAHRDQPATGCPLPAVLSELTRADDGTRAVFEEAFEAAVAEMIAHMPPETGDPRQRALATAALCIGGLTLSRALRGRPVSDEILAACLRCAVPEAADHRR
jgi:TetR/AcrR family transcriptional repressor of nem operon